MDMMERQYFDLECLPLDRIDIFCDVGAYDGYNTRSFFCRCNNQSSRAILLEPGTQNLDMIDKLLRPDFSGRYEVCQKGASDIEGEVSASMSGVWGADDTIQLTTLDTLLDGIDGNVLIKMDIEGDEDKALDGARRFISERHPALAVGVYHKPQDIIEIPRKILLFYPDYRLYLRHYTFYEWDTVLYAVP